MSPRKRAKYRKRRVDFPQQGGLGGDCVVGRQTEEAEWQEEGVMNKGRRESREAMLLSGIHSDSFTGIGDRAANSKSGTNVKVYMI